MNERNREFGQILAIASAPVEGDPEQKKILSHTKICVDCGGGSECGGG
jgi:hypothetical protein